jgi:hypothetical protein
MRNLLWLLLFSAPALAQQPAVRVQPSPSPRPVERIRGPRGSDDSLYNEGTRALDAARWDDAARIFSTAADRKGERADGALYWKAYAENKLGQRDTALATLASLRKDYPASRWLDDAKALEVEIRQQSGQPVSPNSESTDDLKMLALNGLSQSDPEQALPILEKLLKSNNTPKLKDRALFVLTQNRSPKARQILLDVAKGGSNPDLQIRALRYIAMSGQDSRNTLYSIYTATNDLSVKKAILSYFVMSKFTDSNDPLVNIAKNEKNPELRKSAIRMMGTSSHTGDALLALYGSEQEPDIKKQIIEALFIQNNAKALVELARKESNPTIKQEIVQKLSIMRSSEATQYMLEILSK